MSRQKITKLTPEQFKNCSYVECVTTIYDDKYGDGRKTPHVEIEKFVFENGKTMRISENGYKHPEFETRSLSGATKKLNDDIQFYGNENGGMPHFSCEYFLVSNDAPQTNKGYKTAVYGRKSHRNAIEQLENSMRKML